MLFRPAVVAVEPVDGRAGTDLARSTAAMTGFMNTRYFQLSDFGPRPVAQLISRNFPLADVMTRKLSKQAKQNTDQALAMATGSRVHNSTIVNDSDVALPA